MFGLGTILNSAAIILAGVLGTYFGHLLSKKQQESLHLAAGISVLFIGIAGAMEGMQTIVGNHLVSGQAMLIVLSLTVGALIGEWLGIEDGFEHFGEWLKKKTGNSRDAVFVEGFVTASLTVCIGAMAIVGAIEDGILGDYSILATKAVLDFIIILVMASSLGKGAGFSAVPVFLFQGSITVFARLIKPFMTELALTNLSLIGSILIFCVGLNLVFNRNIRVANLLPALLFAILMAYC